MLGSRHGRLLSGFIVLSFGMTVGAQDTLKVKEGDAFPPIALSATQISAVLPDEKNAKELSVQSFKGKKNVVVFFYPKANTPG